MIEFFRAGGPLMWPLLLLSVLSLAVLVERFLVFQASACPKFRETPEEALKAFSSAKGYESFAEALKTGREAAVVSAGNAVVARLEARLSILSVIARLSPLLGLLGTVFGMIETFSAVASAPGGVEMTALADGIWQALITTAAGLSIAIPTILGLSYFESRVDDVAERLNRAGDLILDGDAA